MQAKNLSNQELENTLRMKAAEERKLTLEIIELLEEMDRRKIFLERGYGSLIEYCVKELKYSEASAYRRISAMRVVRDVPETREAIQDGSLNLVTVAKAQTFFKAEAKANHAYTREEKGELLSQLKNQSVRAAEKIFLELSPEAVPAEKVRQVAIDKTQVTLVVDAALMKKLEKLRSLLSHKCDGGYGELIGHLADMALKKLDPEVTPSRNAQVDGELRRSEDPSTVKSQSVANVNRYIPAAMKREVWRQAKGRCCYQNPITGKRCESTNYLEIDHIQPVSRGGEASIENLQLLCDAHNRWKGARAVAGSMQIGKE